MSYQRSRSIPRLSAAAATIVVVDNARSSQHQSSRRGRSKSISRQNSGISTSSGLDTTTSRRGRSARRSSIAMDTEIPEASQGGRRSVSRSKSRGPNGRRTSMHGRADGIAEHVEEQRPMMRSKSNRRSSMHAVPSSTGSITAEEPLPFQERRRRGRSVTSLREAAAVELDASKKERQILRSHSPSGSRAFSRAYSMGKLTNFDPEETTMIKPRLTRQQPTVQRTLSLKSSCNSRMGNSSSAYSSSSRRRVSQTTMAILSIASNLVADVETPGSLKIVNKEKLGNTIKSVSNTNNTMSDASMYSASSGGTASTTSTTRSTEEALKRLKVFQSKYRKSNSRQEQVQEDTAGWWNQERPLLQLNSADTPKTATKTLTTTITDDGVRKVTIASVTSNHENAAIARGA